MAQALPPAFYVCTGNLEKLWSVENMMPHPQGKDDSQDLHFILREAEVRREEVLKSNKPTAALDQIF